jgi:ribosomal protein S18 acetylase RimI-like enzyme
LWWIGVEVGRHRSGIGTRLLEAVEHEIVSVGGAVLVIETSSKTTFDGTRRFYARRGYRDCGTIPDFYAPGEGKVIYARTLNTAR